MTILDLTISGFGKFHNAHFDFSDGLNICYGKNEAGKSTVHTFIRSMLFGMEKRTSRVARDNYTKFEPWDDEGLYEGILRISYKNEIYRIERNFQKDQKRFQIINEKEGLPIASPELFMLKMLFGMTETSYTNTISIGQLKSATEAGMATELKRYINNLNSSGDISINTSSALEYLKSQKLAYEERLVPDAVIKYSSLLGEIKNLEKQISAPEYENTFPKINSLKEQSAKKALDNEKELSTLNQKNASYTNMFKANGFNSKEAIEDLRKTVLKMFNEYKLLIKKEKSFFNNIFRPILLSLSILLLLFHIFSLFCMYPNIINDINVFTYLNTYYKLYINSIFFSPIIIIAIFIFLFILLVFSIMSTIAHLDRKNSIEDLSYTLSEIYAHQLGDSELDDDTFNQFNLHLDDMNKMYLQKEEIEERMAILISEKKEIDAKEKEYYIALQKIQEYQFELDNKLKRVSDLKDTCDGLKKTIQTNDEINKEIEALNLSIETISELSSKIKSSFGVHLNKEASELLNGITNGIYDSISIDESLGVFLNTKDRLVPMDQVSSGTMDQIYLSLRLASANLIMANAEDRLPLLFDDSFVMYDDDRLKSVLIWLTKNIKSQIIIFTCHKRELEVSKSINIAHNIVMI
ncbi:MAG: AAA family ATPase [Eubacteriales bacterium]|nr:AAA family ATPase [Eubacteriales bacterium]